MKDYQVSNVSIVHCIKNYISYDGLFNEYQYYISSISKLVERESFHEAVKDKLWIEAMKALEENYTWNLVPSPACKPIIGCKWVYKLKFNSYGSLSRYKARLVAKGYN